MALLETEAKAAPGKTGKREACTPLSKKHLTPDADLARAVTKDELLAGIKFDIREMYRHSRKG